MVFDTNGDPYHGLTGGNSHDRRAEFIIPAEHRKAGSATYFIEASCNGMFGVNDEMFGEMDGQEEAKEQKEWKLKTADLCVPNMDALRLKWDFEFLRDAGEKLPQDSGVAQRAKWTANAMMNAFKAGDLASCKLARKEAEVALGPNWERVVEEESKHAAELGGTLWAVGHW